ncbi:MAG: hypothetical protein U0556_14830 [Dehalococcoidia bacterium]
METWEEIEAVVEATTACWNAHEHPYTSGKCSRHQPARNPGRWLLPEVA